MKTRNLLAAALFVALAFTSADVANITPAETRVIGAAFKKTWSD